MRLQGKTAIVTGAASGFGRGIAEAFARAASAHAIHFLGNEARLPTSADVEAADRRFHPANIMPA